MEKSRLDRKSTRLNSSHSQISYAVFCLEKKNHRDAVQHAIPQLHQSRAQEVGREQAGDENDDQGKDGAQPRDVDAEPAFGLHRDRQQQQRLVERVEDELQHPDRDDQGDPDEQPGDEVFLHGSGNKKARLAPGRLARWYLLSQWCKPSSSARFSSRSSFRSSFRSWSRASLRASFRQIS